MNTEQIRHVQAKRLAYLVFVYEHRKNVKAGRLQALPASVVHEHLGIEPDEGDRVEEYLKDKGLIKYVTMGPTVAITSYGIDYVEHALAEPDRASEYFPPVNVLHIENVINSQVQQGNIKSSQTADWSGITPGALAEIIADLKTLTNAELTPEDRQDLDANTDTLEAQTKASRVNKTIVREALNTLRSIAEKVGATILAGKIDHLL